ncbi:MAG TPA: transporter substrate-binding domain-containing protein [Nitrospirota bacterium]|nr:transporter substrate-binding domain-containing protein [Nitrospirota bacterium]
MLRGKRRMVIAFISAVCLGLTLFTTISFAADKGESTMERIKRTKVLRVAGLVGEEPYFHKDIKTGEWSGFCIVMARDLAKDLGAKLEVVESTWGNSVLDLQANKIDISFALNPTPQRRQVIDFSDPLFNNSFIIVTRKDFKVGTWEEMNNPKVRVAVDIGSSHEAITRKNAPNATITGYKTRDEAILAVQANKADCFVATVFLGLTALKKNPQLGNFIIPKPVATVPVSAGVRKEEDKQFRDFVGKWAAKNNKSGKIRQWIIEALGTVGISPSDVPAEVQF